MSYYLGNDRMWLRGGYGLSAREDLARKLGKQELPSPEWRKKRRAEFGVREHACEEVEIYEGEVEAFFPNGYLWIHDWSRIPRVSLPGTELLKICHLNELEDEDLNRALLADVGEVARVAQVWRRSEKEKPTDWSGLRDRFEPIEKAASKLAKLLEKVDNPTPRPPTGPSLGELLLGLGASFKQELYRELEKIGLHRDFERIPDDDYRRRVKNPNFNPEGVELGDIILSIRAIEAAAGSQKDRKSHYHGIPLASQEVVIEALAAIFATSLLETVKHRPTSLLKNKPVRLKPDSPWGALSPRQKRMVHNKWKHSKPDEFISLVLESAVIQYRLPLTKQRIREKLRETLIDPPSQNLIYLRPLFPHSLP